ncbi:MAG: F0F1 ATP synthase subunit delta [Pseudomonadota bacterium]
MAESATLARPYANAAFDIAKSDGELPRWSSMLSLLAGAVAEPAVQELLETPSLDDEAKARRLADLFKDQLNDRAKRFLNVLATNKRLPLLAEIAGQFEERRAEEEQTLDVEVVSAYPLTDEQVDQLTQGLKRRFGKAVEMTSRIDTSLMGGAIIRAGDTVIDGSIVGKLNKLKEALQRS